jgi:acyl-homoserine lactone acylase PvdQ
MARFAPLARLPRPARWTVRRSFPERDGRLTVKGLGADATVRRDRWGVPQIYADTAEDLVRAQGYVHAQDRFWEMDFRRHVTAGRLSELFGRATLDTDRVVRTLGWRRVAERELGLLRPETRRYLEAYAGGVNAWLSAHPDTASQSLEYAVLGLRRTGYAPEPWTPVDSLAWLKAMAWDLRSNLGDELGRALASTRVPAGRPGGPAVSPLPVRPQPGDRPWFPGGCAGPASARTPGWSRETVPVPASRCRPTIRTSRRTCRRCGSRPGCTAAGSVTPARSTSPASPSPASPGS